MKKIFNKSRELENEINVYLDTVSRAMLIMKRDLENYIRKKYDIFEEGVNEILEIENQADNYQKQIKYKLYKYMLIPEARGDVLLLLESSDNVVDLAKKVIIQLSIEKPDIPEYLEKDYLDLVDKTVLTVEQLLKALRAYFEEIMMVNEYLNKVHFYEHEADKIEERIKRKVFSTESSMEFSRKVHLRYFCEKIAFLADEAETISERVSVAAIKRSI